MFAYISQYLTFLLILSSNIFLRNQFFKSIFVEVTYHPCFLRAIMRFRIFINNVLSNKCFNNFKSRID